MPWKQLIRTRDNPLSVPPQAREYRSFFRPFEARGPGPGVGSLGVFFCTVLHSSVTVSV